MLEASLTPGLSARDALALGTAVLQPHDPADAGTDARRLLLHALGWTALDLVKSPDRALANNDTAIYRQLLDRRRAGEPVSRITGRRGFYGREFIVSSATLDPRPESETLIDTALDLMSATYPSGAGLDILDIGTGTGCLLLTLLAEWPAARGTGIDPSAKALTIAATNAANLGVSDRCTWVQGYDFVGLLQRFPLIISNPPYIPSNDIAALAREVRDHDPILALDGGPDGLNVYRSIASGLDAHATPGWVLLEAGDGQSAAIAAIVAAALPAARHGACKVVADMAGKPRCVAIEIRG